MSVVAAEPKKSDSESSSPLSNVSELMNQAGDLVKSVAENMPEWLSAAKDEISSSPAKALAAGVAAWWISRPLIDYATRKLRRYPPGMIGVVPFVSTLRKMDINDTQMLLDEPHLYGSVSMHYMGLTPVCLLNDRSATDFIYIESGEVNRHFPMTPEECEEWEQIWFDVHAGNTFSMINENCGWSERRKHFVKAQAALLRIDTLTRMINQHLSEEVFPTIKSGELWINMRNIVSRMIFHTMFHFGFGSQMEPKKEDLDGFIRDTQKLFNGIPIINLCNRMPNQRLGAATAGFLLGDLTGLFGKLNAQIGEWMKEYKKLPERTEAQYAEVLQAKIDEGEISAAHAYRDVTTLFFAGTHTTSTNLEQAITNLARVPELQKEMHNALHRTFVDASKISVSRIRKEVPLFHAFILETLRLSESVRISLARVLGKDLHNKKDGYTLPKGSMVVTNSYAMNRDVRVWGDDSMIFRPRRWMSDDGKSLRSDMKSELATFGFGKRNCPGLDLAKKQIILIAAHFLYRYKVDCPSYGTEIPLLTWSDYNEKLCQYPLRLTEWDE